MSGIPWETVTLTTLSRDRILFPQLLAEARDVAMRGQEGKLVIHTPWGIEWKPFGLPRRKRPLKSVVLQDGVAEQLEKDVSAFLQRRQWYADRGSKNDFHSWMIPHNVSRNTLQTGLSITWTSGLWQVFFYPSSSRVTLIRHLSPQLVRAGPR